MITACTGYNHAAALQEKEAFKYCNVWSTHPQFIEIVEEGWKQNIEAWKMFQVVKKLKGLKPKLQKLHKSNFNNIVKEATMDRENLLKCEELLELNPLDVHLQQEERRLGAKFKRLTYLIEIFLQQRSKATRMRLWDDNTRYFYSMIKHRKLVQVVTQLQDSNGNIQDDPTTIAKLFVQFYKELLGK